MPGLFDYLLKKATGRIREKDIELESESGEVDPRLPKVGQNLRDSFRSANEYAAGSDSPTERLRRAGRKAAERRR